MGHVSIYGPREEADKVLDDGHLAIHEEVLRMLTPRRAGPVGPEEIGDGPDDKGASNVASGSVTPDGSYENTDGSKEFLSSGRTGRRNALPNILGRHAKTGLSDLPDRFGALSTHSDRSNNSGQDPDVPGTSKQHG
ncbi:cAMP-dependent protein kinase inhibitor beta [Harpegnathos saltator]|uniref:cAMP-dependent protein kinase inhibitor beta n=1 Tax=Harpegnathos saltator TaxID=610380 RepID=UPI00058F7F19|nr:cAMP-dependent protein kinase inhibitor beta [Harpegnathos saltator]